VRGFFTHRPLREGGNEMFAGLRELRCPGPVGGRQRFCALDDARMSV
jgi:hypothetical protein